MAIENYISENIPEHLGELQPYIDAVSKGITKTTEIISSLNRYSRKDSGYYTRCNVHQVIDNCLTMLLSQYKFRVEIIREYSEYLPEIMASEGKLHQAFINVLINAIQSIEETGTVVIKTSLTNDVVTIRIIDTGSGIAPEHLRYIFDPFFTTKDPGKGTGLGLSITRNIIKEHNGTIQCKSEQGGGSEFIINLPVNR
jgi:signal transduction histidine kinase